MPRDHVILSAHHVDMGELSKIEALEKQIEEALQSVQQAAQTLSTQRKLSSLAENSGAIAIFSLIVMIVGCYEPTDIGIVLFSVSIILFCLVGIGLIERIRHSLVAAKYRNAASSAEGRLWWVKKEKEKEEERLAALARLRQDGFSNEILKDPWLAYKLYGFDVLEVWFECVEPLYREDRGVSIMGRAGYPEDWLWRKEWLKKARFERCEWCKTEFDDFFRSPHVHHIFTIAEGGTHELWNLKLLCKKCHEKAHDSKFDNTRGKGHRPRYRT